MVQAPGQEVAELRVARDVGDGETSASSHGSKRLTTSPAPKVEYLPDEHRFVATVAGSDEVAFLDVVPATTVWTFAHTEVPERLAGAGIGSALVKAALDHARAIGVNVIPRCPFVAAYMRRHPHEQDLVTDRYKFLVENER